MANPNKVLEFIQRRFHSDCKWLDGNCFYFASILKARFPESTVLYDVVSGHFVVRIGGVEYDWNGVVSGEHQYVEWERFKEYDPLQWERIVRDCIE